MLPSGGLLEDYLVLQTVHMLLCTCPRLHNRSPPCPTYKSVMLLTGDRGCGKTSVLANWVQEFSSRDDLKVFAHYVGSSALSFDIMCFMRRCTVEMRDKGPQLQRESWPDTSLVGCMCVCMFIKGSTEEVYKHLVDIC